LAVIVQAEHGFEQEQTPPLPEKTAFRILPQDGNGNPGQEIDQQQGDIVLSGHEAAAAAASTLGPACNAKGSQVKIGHDPGQLLLTEHRLGQHPGKRFVSGQDRGKLGREPLGHTEPGLEATAVKIPHGKKRLRAHHGLLE
jgi:hypothetical protein